MDRWWESGLQKLSDLLFTSHASSLPLLSRTLKLKLQEPHLVSWKLAACSFHDFISEPGDPLGASLVPFPRLTPIPQDVVSDRASAYQGPSACWVPGMPSTIVTPKLAVQGLAFLLEAGLFRHSGVCEPSIQQERCLTLEYPSEHMAEP